jgi:DNA polymerase-3 subunit gamma/tau
MLSKNAFNALLKTLEEPPAHAKFIFATTELEKVPETIVSRCLQIQLRPMSIETIQAHLQKISTIENLPSDADGLMLIAEAAKGSMRDGLSILEKVSSYTRSTGESMTMDVVERILGRPPQAELQRLCLAIKSGEVISAIQGVRSLFSHDIEPMAIAKGLLTALHQSLCSTIGVQNDNHTFFKELSVAQLNRLWSIVHTSIQELMNSPVPQESCEVMLIRLCHVSDIPPLKQLIQDIENKLSSSESIGSASAQHSVSATAVHAQPISNKTNLTSFDQLIEWVETQKDPHLSFFLKRDLRVHGFKPGYIECSLKNSEDQPLLKHLKQLLQTALNETWTFELVHSTTATPATFHEQAQTHEANAKQRVIDSELVQHALQAFEGASVVVDRVLLDS